ncbi:nicotinate (nicotinamide) nucleotide adenylyltransferase [Moraxella sp.]|uniref:nicotinate (nicotinamide) nucleotide adenylyltransferase n=1 Tax=Moraxella sp. TaxID=479 RepID=UPI00260774C4|nr:nicotinate (nicotinamide) nucleotide adenylyltransferase [Moraxella sp.]MCP3896284.1 nicotinate (nicotinamide) nucleotide adenylyltransferase [Moraxella sp.]
MTTAPTIRAFLGGSFDPVHLSHLQMATHVHQTLSQFIQNDPHGRFAKIDVCLLPTAGNPFKDKPTADAHRLEMLRLATQGTPINIDTHELAQTPPVYTIDTVRHLRQIYPNDRLIFIMGQDSLHALPTWKDGDEILDFVNIWAFMRGDFEPVGDLSTQVLENLTDDLGEFLSQNGRIYQDNTPITAMSSSMVRKLLADRDPKARQFLTKSVLDYIDKHAIYA